MLVFQVSPTRLLSTVTLLISAMGISACAQEKPKRMVRGAEVNVLVPDSKSTNEDGISQIVFGMIFKEGETEYTRVGPGALKNAPSLPTGHVLFRNLVFDVKTQAIVSGAHLTVFRLPSVENETDFDRLSLLHLEYDELSPSGWSWAPVIVFQNGWQEHHHNISKAQYDAVLPDFKSRRIAGVTNQFGIFAITTVHEEGPGVNGPFTQLDVTTANTPDPVSEGQEVTHTITIKNKGPGTAAEVNVKTEISPDFDHISVTSNQGTCKRSMRSSGRTLCYLGAMPTGATAIIRIVSRVRHDLFFRENSIETREFIEIASKEKSTDFVVAENQIFKEFLTRIVRKP